MKNKFIALLLSIGPVGLIFSAEKPKPKLKIPHRHDSKYGGRVHMLGDSHFEVLRKGGMLMVYFYDKFGEDIAVSEFNVSTTLVNGDKKEELKFTVDKKVLNQIHVELPKNVDTSLAVLELKAKRINPPKGEMSLDTPLKIGLGTVKVSSDPHAGHNM